MAAGLSVDLDRWRREFDELMLRVGGRFARVEPRRRMAAFVRGLLAGLPRVNCWTIAEHAGENGPRGMQRLLSAAVWDDAGVRDDLRGYVLEHFADPGAVLVVDETGDLKKGTATVGTQRQYTGTAGRTENAQVAVYLAYAAPAGTAFIDRALYLPRSWTSDPARCRAAGVPGDTAFATKPALARQMITGALDAGTPAAWATADEVYGQDPKLRAELARRGLGYVLAVARSHPLTTPAGTFPAIGLARRLPARAWHRVSAGPGAKGPRWYDWALTEVTDPAVTESSGQHWLLIRRRISDGEYAFYRACAPRPVPLARLVQVAGSRWKVEDGFAAGKELAALDEHQVRSWASWHRWTILALLAHAFLAVQAATQPGAGRAHDDQLIPLTCHEIRRLFTGLCRQPPDPATQLHWSRWRRRHQYTARACHYRRRALAPEPLRSVAGVLTRMHSWYRPSRPQAVPQAAESTARTCDLSAETVHFMETPHSAETLHRVEIKHAGDVRNFRLMHSFHDHRRWTRTAGSPTAPGLREHHAPLGFHGTALTARTVSRPGPARGSTTSRWPDRRSTIPFGMLVVATLTSGRARR